MAKTLKDNRGNDIPIRFVPEKERRATALVEKVIRKALAFEKEMKEIKAAMLADIDKYSDWLAENYKTKKEDWKGNIQISDFSSTIRIQLRLTDNIIFDDRLTLAKGKINECLTRWAEGSREELKIIVNTAFSVDKKGQVNRQQILGLLQYKIKDPLWVEAMDLIKESIKVVGQRQYFIIERRNRDGKWEQINLNFSNI